MYCVCVLVFLCCCVGCCSVWLCGVVGVEAELLLNHTLIEMFIAENAPKALQATGLGSK